MSDFSLWINGKATAGAMTMPVINPATEEVVAICPRASAEQLDQAVAAAKAAFPAWAATPWATRRDKIVAICDALEADADYLARLLTSEQGKPLADAMGEVLGSVYMMRVLATLEIEEKILSDDAMGKAIEHRTPLGVVAAITPWNFPISLLVVKMVPALLAGNTMVAKPAPTTPLTSLRIAELANKILPAGVFNIITDLNDLGAQLTSHPDVKKISFTGSTATGKRVVTSAASALKRFTLELGGNDAAIILDDLAPKDAAKKLFDGAMVNSGQVCLAIKRAYVPTGMYDAVCDELVKLANETVIGDGSRQGTQYGPVQNKAQFDKVNEQIESARKEGKIIAGGTPTEGAGYFIRPTIVRDLPDNARLVREEQFGPVLPVLSYDNIDDVISRANDSDFGLGGTVWTANPDRGVEVAKKIDSGVVWVNTHMAVNPLVSVGGAKQSGMGQELGLDGLEEFTQRHVVIVAPAA